MAHSRRAQSAQKLREKVDFRHDDPQAIFPAAWVWGSITVKRFHYRGNVAE
jgi:hypothetical protein